MNLAVLLVGIVRMHDTVRHLDMGSIQGQLEQLLRYPLDLLRSQSSLPRVGVRYLVMCRFVMQGFVNVRRRFGRLRFVIFAHWSLTDGR